MRYLFPTHAFLILLITGGCSSYRESERVSWPENCSPQKTGNLLCREMLSRGDYMMYRTGEITTLHYAEICAAFGVVRFAGVMADTSLVQEVEARYRGISDSGLISTVGHVDVNVYGILPLELYRHTGHVGYLEEGLHYADQQWANPLADGLSEQTRFWIDDIYMIAILQTQAYRATGDMIYLNRAALEVVRYLEKLQQPNGLFFHGENAPFHWGRGNGWVAAGLAELIAVLPESNPHYGYILAAYKKMMDSLLKYQAESGMWRQLIDHPEAWEETSSTAMFGYAISAGINRGILTGRSYQDACRKAWLALCAHLDEEGKLADVCVGTGQSTDVNYYLERPRTRGDFHGQAPMLWFASSLLTPTSDRF